MFGQPFQSDPLTTRIKNFILAKNSLSRLILINTAVYILILITKLSFFLLNEPDILIYKIGLPALPESIYLHPYTLITYMFSHENFFHYLFNMLSLYFAGIIFINFLDGRKLLFVYLLGGLMGAAFYILAFNTFPVFSEKVHLSYAIGASASVMAILLAAVAYKPNATLQFFLLGSLKIKYLALIFVAIDILSIPGSNSGGHIAHLGGAMFGLLSGLYFRRPPLKFSIFKRRQKKLKFTINPRPVNDDQYRANRAMDQNKMDSILDKISKRGYDSLTKDEKEFLFRKK